MTHKKEKKVVKYKGTTNYREIYRVTELDGRCFRETKPQEGNGGYKVTARYVKENNHRKIYKR